MMIITVYGQPAPQGSKRHVGHGVMIESSKAVKPWREAVKYAALAARSGAATLNGAIQVDMTFTLPRPKSVSPRKRPYPDRKPDISKLVRSTEDAMTDAGVWSDDARVVTCIARKRYVGDAEVDVLDAPGAVIRVQEIRAEQ